MDQIALIIVPERGHLAASVDMACDKVEAAATTGEGAVIIVVLLDQALIPRRLVDARQMTDDPKVAAGPGRSARIQIRLIGVLGEVAIGGDDALLQ